MNFKYTSMEQSLRLQAEVYTLRAKMLLDAKKLDKAIGCLNKAIRKIKRADMLKLAPLEEAIYGPAMNSLVS